MNANAKKKRQLANNISTLRANIIMLRKEFSDSDKLRLKLLKELTDKYNNWPDHLKVVK